MMKPFWDSCTCAYLHVIIYREDSHHDVIDQSFNLAAALKRGCEIIICSFTEPAAGGRMIS